MEYNLVISIVLYHTDVSEVNNIIQKVSKSSLKIKLILVDNSETPGIEKEIIQQPFVEYIFSGENKGFGAGHNKAIALSENIAEYHLVLNADVDFDPSILHKLYSFMEEHKEVGLAVPKVLNPDGSLQYSVKLLPTPLNLIVRRFIPIKRVQDYFDHNYELKFWDHQSVISVPYVMGCFMFIRRALLQEVGYFDEQFFMYPEDIDLSRRIFECADVRYLPELNIYHKHGKGSYKSNKLLYYHVTSMVKYFNKWGWIFDKRRRKVNKEILNQFKS